MARPLRIEFEGALYHVMSRGNERRAIVRDDVDREQRLDWLRRTVESYGWNLHAFCLMTNHDHLFLDTPHANLAAGMQFLNGSYTSGFNRRHRRHGHLFQGRYKAQLIESEGHYLDISRYIHLNPLRAKMVERLEHYRWSSYPGYHWSRSTVPWVQYDRVLREFGRDRQRARSAYRAFVQTGIKTPPVSPFEDAVEGLLIGSQSFVERIRELIDNREDDLDVPTLQALRTHPPLSAIIDHVAGLFGVERTRICRSGTRSDDPCRAAAAWLARRRFGYSAAETARALGYARSSSVSNAVKRIEAHPHSSDLRCRLRAVEGLIKSAND